DPGLGDRDRTTGAVLHHQAFGVLEADGLPLLADRDGAQRSDRSDEQRHQRHHGAHPQPAEPPPARLLARRGVQPPCRERHLRFLPGVRIAPPLTFPRPRPGATGRCRSQSCPPVPRRYSSTARTRRWSWSSWPRSSLVKMDRMCFSTARSVITRRAAMPALFSPSAITPSTSDSRGLSRSRALSEFRLSSWETTSGSIAAPPPATRRSVPRNSSMSATRSLSR